MLKKRILDMFRREYKGMFNLITLKILGYRRTLLAYIEETICQIFEKISRKQFMDSCNGYLSPRSETFQHPKNK